MSKEKEFEKFYRSIVTVCGVLCLAAIVVAVLYKVSVGIIIALAAVLLYVFSVNHKLKKTFGLGYKRNEDGISVFVLSDTVCEAIPSRLMWLDVTELSASKKGGAKSLRIPKSVLRIDGAAFEGVETVIYEGSLEEWKSVACSADTAAVTVIFLGGEK